MAMLASSSSPLLFDLHVPVVSLGRPQYSSHGRQKPFAESPIHRRARSDFLSVSEKMQKDKEQQHLTREQRLGQWLATQPHFPPLGSPSSSRTPSLTPEDESEDESSDSGSSNSEHQPSGAPSRHPSRPHHHHRSYSPSSLLYAIPEDSDIPEGYREPYIFYSTSPTTPTNVVPETKHSYHHLSAPSPSLMRTRSRGTTTTGGFTAPSVASSPTLRKRPSLESIPEGDE